jgi:hypothetical protein
MRAFIDREGARFGWSKQWSDAPSEWWHVLYQAGHYSGPDPGPHGQAAPPPKPPQPTVEVAFVAGPTAFNKDGRIEVFKEHAGEIRHKWQRQPNQAFVPDWESLGKV